MVLLWPPGSNPAAGETTGLLTMPLGSATTPDPSRYRDVRYQGGAGLRRRRRGACPGWLRALGTPQTDPHTLLPALPRAVTGCNTGTSGSLQGGLPLPPIYIAERTSYSEPSSEPPPPSEEERQLPATCDPQDPAQASLTFPWSAVFTFYTC